MNAFCNPARDLEELRELPHVVRRAARLGDVAELDRLAVRVLTLTVRSWEHPELLPEFQTAAAVLVTCRAAVLNLSPRSVRRA